MNTNYLEQAKERLPNVPLLINVVARRVRQLNQGQRPLIKPDSPHMPHLDLALKEVAAGKLTAEVSFTAPEAEPVAIPDNLITL
ncbi:MAG: DNA-directed RNA polymerase subunit omega [Verrucomicrobia bacterium]|nr:DNA-directed RNA polymerase subunit omega [Verrucomicrobiota bacterium]